MTLALLLETADHTVDLPLRCWCQQLLGLIEHVGVKPKTGGNRQSIAAPGDTPKQVVGRRKGLSVEGHRSILEPRVAVFESLQLTEMRGGDRESGAVGESLEQGGCESCSLTRIRTSSNLIQQNEGRGRSRSQSRQDATDALHMTAEGGQALLERLLISDIRQNLGTPGQ